jgi:hypothetical protein
LSPGYSSVLSHNSDIVCSVCPRNRWNPVGKQTLTLNQISPAMGIPMGYVYLVLPSTGILMIYYSLIFIGEAYLKKDQVETGTKVSVID